MDENQIYSIENTAQNQQNQQSNNTGMGNHGKKYFYCGLITGLAVALLIVSGVYLATRIEAYFNAQNNVASYATGVSTETTEASEKLTTAITPDMIEKMKVIEEVIDTYFYHEDIDKKLLEEGAYKGMVEALGDPYSAYYSMEDLEQLYRDSQGIYYGIGAYVSLDTATGLAKVSGIIAQTPAEEAELRENDIIYKVDDKEVYGLTLQETVSLIKGEEGTTVKLTLIRDGLEIEKDVVRRKVESPTVNSEMLNNGMAYIQITEFDTITVDQFTEALAVAKGSDMKGLILDLRSNPGGNLSAVVDIARMLLPEGMIVYTEDRDGNRDEYTCDGTKQLQVPMVVLVNGNSASASEILAGAIKDYGTGTLLGTTTFGKGIVQRPVELSDGSAVKLTISSYYTPNGINIHGVGIEPDEVCEFDGERYYSDEKYDNQLERAKELLGTMIQ
ncbi:MAG TPA: S41 family peptidase [Lachnospiraceae bacterium]|nr:S41 family peptidase [Lachnospiraceae bacterium]